FSVLFSTSIPIGWTVNLDMGKSTCVWFIEHDKGIKDTVLWLGLATFPRRFVRVEYLLSCKTAVLMQNNKGLREIHVDTVSYAGEAMDQVRDYIRLRFFDGSSRTSGSAPGVQLDVATTRTGREMGSRV
ncbi:hypothetical protein HOY80DRAFT_887001, partial [Tuber brumale]